MSLIPSESLNFPDSFRANVGWRLDEIDDPEGLGAPQGLSVAPDPFAPPLETPPKDSVAPVPPSAVASKPAANRDAPVPLPAETSAFVPPPPEASSIGADEQQLELIPNVTEELPAESAAGPAQLDALLKYFMAAGAAPATPLAPPNGNSAIDDEIIATTTAVVPTNIAVEADQPVSLPNESLTTFPLNVEPAFASPPAEQETVPDNRGKPASDQQSIVAALESLSHSDAEAPIGSVDIQTPAQANHILELIAAAVQRGALVGETIPESGAATASPPAVAPPSPPPAAAPLSPAPRATPPSPPEPVSDHSIAPAPMPSPEKSPVAPDPIFSIPKTPIPAQVPVFESAPVSEPLVTAPKPAAPIPTATPAPAMHPVKEKVAPVPPAAVAAAPPARAADAAKVPAKIRITPRKIKPRPQVEPREEEVSLGPVSDDSPPEISPVVKVSLALERKPGSSVAAEPKVAAKSMEPSETMPPRPELSARKIAAARLELAQSDLFLFNARQRRNRWVGFGLSEFAVVTALVLLGRYGFTHRFPDPTIKMLVFILIFAAAAVAVALPIAFFRNDPQRWDRGDR